MKERKFYAEIFLVSLAAILLEIGHTRVFSFKLYYYFTYLIIGVALLGIGSGAVLVAIVPRLRAVAVPRLIAVCCLVAGASVAVGYVVVALTQLNTFHLTDHVAEVVKLAVVCAFLFAPFLMGGVVVATILGTRPHDINRLYFADLIGAGLGCVSSVPLIYLLTPPGCVVLSGLVFVVAGMRLAATDFRAVLPFSVTLAAVLLLATLFPRVLPDPVPDEFKTMSPQAHGNAKVLFSQWSPVFRIDVMESGRADVYFINHDGMVGSGLHRFNGDVASLTQFDADVRSYPFRLLKEAPRVIIIGAAGGHEILASLHFGAAHITAVELNPVTVSLLTDHFADYSGHLAENDRVTLVNADGRSFLQRDNQKYDLIWFVAPDSYSAMNAATSGAFVLSESYLYTTGMIRESLDHLADGGLICMQFGEVNFDQKPNRTARYLGTARAAFEQMGVNDFEKHVLVSTSPSWPLLLSTILIKKTAFSAEEVQRFLENTQLLTGSKVRHAWGGSQPEGPVNKVIALPEAALAAWYARYPYDIRAITDDSPFFWHFARFRDVVANTTVAKDRGWDLEDATGERILLVLLAFVTAFAAVFLLLPLMAIRDTWKQIPHKTMAAVYFAAIGTGFMFFEVSLIQRFTLFLGYPTYSLTVTLFALLIFTGLGSLWSDRYRGRRNLALLALLAAVLALVLLYRFALGPVVDRCIGFALVTRVGLAILFMAPLGLCLGAFMPLGLATIAAVTEHKREFIAWGWAVNGFFSVISSILTTILSMTIGFKMVLLAAGVVYAVGVLFLMRIPAPTAESP